jgi:hypothetical protein
VGVRRERIRIPSHHRIGTSAPASFTVWADRRWMNHENRYCLFHDRRGDWFDAELRAVVDGRRIGDLHRHWLGGLLEYHAGYGVRGSP